MPKAMALSPGQVFYRPSLLRDPRTPLILHESFRRLAFGHFGVLCLGQAMLLQQGIDLVGSPEVVVDVPGLRPANGRELNYANVSSLPRPGSGRYGLFSLLSLVESIVLLSTLTASPQASFRSQSSL